MKKQRNTKISHIKTKMNVHSIESPAIVYNLKHFWLLYTMTGYSIEWPIIHIDRNIYIDSSIIHKSG